METLKRCSKCQQELPATAEYFFRRRDMADGFQAHCKVCDNERNRETVLARTREWKAKNPDNARNYRAANRSAFALYTRTRKDRVAGLPNTLTKEQWQFALDYFGGCCAVCGRSLYGVLHTPAIDHWVPISDPRCPGSVVANAIPLCHGVGGCNNSKNDSDPEEWLLTTFGKKRAKVILARILAYVTLVST